MNRGNLIVITDTGAIIQEAVSADTFVKAIEEAIRLMGPEAVLDTNITWCKFPLITDDARVITVPKYQKALKGCWGNNIWVNTCSSDVQKKKLLEKLFSELDLYWSVTIDSSIS